MADEPTLGEVMRQVRDLVQQVRDLVKEVRSDYVRKELYDARHASLTRRVEEIERENEDNEKARLAFQRQIVGGVIVGVILMLAQIVVTALLVMGGLK
jgi:hypothetical protein